MKRITLHLVVGAMLAVATIAVGYDLYKTGALGTHEKLLESLTKIVVLLLTGLGALYALFIKHGDALEVVDRQGEIARDNAVLQKVAESYLTLQLQPKINDLETLAKAAQQYNQLRYQEDFEKRKERYQLLKTFSENLIFTSREFRKIVGYRPHLGGTSETMVNLLGVALSARQLFIAARDQLEPMHIVDTKKHKPLIKEYSQVLIDIIIDVQRPASLSASSLEDYVKVMDKHSVNLESAHDKICEILAVFLAPQVRP